MASLDKIIGSCLRGVGAIGSLLVRRNAEGRYEIAVAPLPALLLVTSAVTCTVQNAEPFRQCVRSNLTLIQEVVNAF